MLRQWNGFTCNGVREIKGESDGHSHMREEEIFYCQTHPRACMHTQMRDSRGGGGARRPRECRREMEVR